MLDKELNSLAQQALAEIVVNAQRCQTSIAIIKLQKGDADIPKMLQNANKDLISVISMLRERIQPEQILDQQLGQEPEGEKECEHFKWDCDWYYCELQDKEIDPSDCCKCNIKKTVKRRKLFGLF